MPSPPRLDRDPTIQLAGPASPGRLALVHAAGRVALEPGRPLLLGSGPLADLQLADRYASARHARIFADGDRHVIEDEGSTNGTYVDGVRVARAYLGPGAHVQLGGWRASVVAQHPRPRPQPGPLGMVGASPAFCALERALLRLAPLPQPVLVRGETGTGKELAARALHQHSPRAAGPFVALNCGAIPEGLCESELFGHVRGAFTGAVRAHHGAFARASGGTLFLDEVAELPLPLQAKLLRVLETRRVVPVGGEGEQAVEVRVVAATHQPLEALVAAQRFRGDLLHRLGALQVDLPALRDRSADIPALLEHFAAGLASELGRPICLTPAAVAAATAHAWPGNIRELHNALLRAAATADGPLTAADLVPTARAAAPPAIAVPRGTYAEMHRALLHRVVDDAGSIRKAALQLAIPRSTLAAWLHGAP
ncbi:MAG: sigma 54-dependent Fis family transcriptional regulator [Nannocystis sp.]|uniref:sigma 54-interacting transcriptional regulator n=1 Tax=Nannocystis sp. TaxID=1962667 RepID=UPI002421E0D2|nr:sigma 54-interacting transcriptional regulator [Nannocystis sp.]MBK9757171.1 sigma 54-dependent Fis family transcriptional regulator [Nannocystis sp.]